LVHPRHLYVHVPFCARRCSYCDFSIAVRRTTPVDEYLRALETELRLRFPPSGDWQLDTVYFGGGTPSRLGGEGIARLLDLIRRHATLASDAEVTIEANPDDVDPASVAAWREAGVNRMSLGVQSFDPSVLQWMHRVHDPESAVAAVRVARAAGLADISLDLIFALPASLARDWSRDLDLALQLEPTHLSLYGLTVEHRTPVARWRDRGELEEAPEEHYESEYLEAHARLTAAGMDHYEVSNFGRPGAHARHNSAYWSGVAYGGIGPAAHEYDEAGRRWNVSPYAEWVRRLEAGEDPIGGQELLTPENRAAENVYLGLRTASGLRLAGDELDRADPWIRAGWGLVEDGVLRLSPLGWLRLDALAADLTLVRSR
jgi:oxygen-independent coproporphyrinogen-3 oxidase